MMGLCALVELANRFLHNGREGVVVTLIALNICAAVTSFLFAVKFLCEISVDGTLVCCFMK